MFAASCTFLLRLPVDRLVAQLALFIDVVNVRPSMFHYGAPMLKTALRLGLGYQPLAVVCMDALESWMGKFGGTSTTMRTVNGACFHALAAYLDADTAADKRHGAAHTYRNLPAVIVPVKSRSAQRKSIYASKRSGRYVSTSMNSLTVGVGELGEQQRAAVDARLLQMRVATYLGEIGAFVPAVRTRAASTTDTRATASVERDALVRWSPGVSLTYRLPFDDCQAALCLGTVPRGLLYARRRVHPAHAAAVPHGDRSADEDGGVRAAARERRLPRRQAESARGEEGRRPATTRAPRHLQARPPLGRPPVHRRLVEDVVWRTSLGEPVAEQLFRPLLHQLINWTTAQTAEAETAQTDCLLGALFDRLVDEETSAHERRFGAQMLNEYVKSAVRVVKQQHGVRWHRPDDGFL